MRNKDGIPGGHLSETGITDFSLQASTDKSLITVFSDSYIVFKMELLMLQTRFGNMYDGVSYQSKIRTSVVPCACVPIRPRETSPEWRKVDVGCTCRSIFRLSQSLTVWIKCELSINAGKLEKNLASVSREACSPIQMQRCCRVLSCSISSEFGNQVIRKRKHQSIIVQHCFHLDMKWSVNLTVHTLRITRTRECVKV